MTASSEASCVVAKGRCHHIYAEHPQLLLPYTREAPLVATWVLFTIIQDTQLPHTWYTASLIAVSAARTLPTLPARRNQIIGYRQMLIGACCRLLSPALCIWYSYAPGMVAEIPRGENVDEPAKERKKYR